MSAAVLHLLRQIKTSPRLAYLIGPGTESYDLLTQERAQTEGVPVEQFRERFEATLKTERTFTVRAIADGLGLGEEYVRDQLED